MTATSVREHELKCWPAYFKDVLRGDKNFEVRPDDRTPPFHVGDTLVLREWDERNGYSGDKLWRRITYILPGDQFGIEAGYCVMGLGTTATTSEGDAVNVKDLRAFLKDRRSYAPDLKQLDDDTLADFFEIVSAFTQDLQDELNRRTLAGSRVVGDTQT
jgi:hypothetical protein